MDYMNRKGNLSLQVSSFSNIESLLEYMEHTFVNILLMAENTKFESSKIENQIKNIYILSEGQSVREETSFPTIYKFQSADHVMQEVLDLYMEGNQGAPTLAQVTNSGKQQIIGVFSPKGGSKKTTFSIILSQIYGGYKKTLYINLEQFSELSWFNKNGNMGFSELLYYIKQRNPNLILKVNALVIKKNAFDYILPVRHYEDLFDMNQEDVSYLIHCLRSFSDYEVIILDIGILGQATSTLFKECNKIYVPVDEDLLSKDKIEAFYRQLREKKEDNLIERMEEISLPYDLEIAGGNLSIEALSQGILFDYIVQLVDRGGER